MKTLSRHSAEWSLALRGHLSALWILVCLFSLPVSVAHGQEVGELRFAKIIGDQLVLQQEKPIKVWGWAKAGADVVVTITQDPQVGTQAIAAAVASGQRREMSSTEHDDHAVTVQYVERNPSKLAPQTIQVTADADGLWVATFEPAKASFRPTWISAD